MNQTNCDAMAALLQEWLNADLEVDAPEFETWIGSFTDRVEDALTIHRTITERNP